jgi:hypothetical protein
MDEQPKTLADLLEEIQSQVRPGPRCHVGRVFDHLTEADRKTLEEALSSERYSARAISGALRLRGLTVSRSSIERHRRGECRCWKTT